MSERLTNNYSNESKGVKMILSHLSLMGQLTLFVTSFPSSLLTTYSISVSPSVLQVLGPGFKL